MLSLVEREFFLVTLRPVLCIKELKQKTIGTVLLF